MTDTVTRSHAGHDHKHDGPATANGDRRTRAWENPADRLVDLLEQGVTLTRVERAVAEAELQARERRRRSPAVVRGKDLVFEPSSWPGVEIAYVISPYLHGIEVQNFTLEMHRIAPKASTRRHRHWERVCHVLSGTGYTLFGADGERRVEWGPHDSVHIKMGEWHQHVVTSSEPAVILAGKTDLVASRLAPYRLQGTGDSFSDLPIDFRPEHPFTHELVEIGYAGGEKWMSKHQLHAREIVDTAEAELRESRSVMRAEEVVIERSEHKGDYRAALIEPSVGFKTRMLAMYVQQLPPGCHTETHGTERRSCTSFLDMDTASSMVIGTSGSRATVSSSSPVRFISTSTPTRSCTRSTSPSTSRPSRTGPLVEQ